MTHAELRPGNFFKNCLGEIFRIEEINIQSEPAGSWPTLSFRISCDDRWWSHSYFGSDDFIPIPIDESWLAKLGFTVKKEWPSGFGVSYYREDMKVEVGISVRHGNTVNLACEKDRNRFMFKYVHELQNLHHFFTGENITCEEW